MRDFILKCQACGKDITIAFPTGQNVSCPICGVLGPYWQGHLNINAECAKRPRMSLVVFVFYPKRLEPFLDSYRQHKPGCDVDLFFVQNAFDVGALNRGSVIGSNLSATTDLISSCGAKNKTVIRRENVGEDLGAYKMVYDLIKNNYEFTFFINEAAIIKKDNWLKDYLDVYDTNPEVVAAGPKVLDKGIPQYKYIICSTYWSLRNSWGKDMKWPVPQDRFDSKAQEMQLVWPQVNKDGLKIAQVGKGTEILHYGQITDSMTAGEGVF